VAELIVFSEPNYGGVHTHLYGDTTNGHTISVDGILVSGGSDKDTWKNRIASFAVESGWWKFSARDAQGVEQVIGTSDGKSLWFGPCFVADVSTVGMAVKSISSVEWSVFPQR
jgi:hypothetical protein